MFRVILRTQNCRYTNINKFNNTFQEEIQAPRFRIRD